MLAEIEEFYFSRGLPIDRLIDIGTSQHRLRRDYIEQAIVQVFEKESGLKRHQIAWRIFALAREKYSKVQMETHIARLNIVTKPEEPRPFMEEELKASPMVAPETIPLNLPDPSIVIGGTRRTLSERLFLSPAAAVVVFIAIVAYAYLGGLQ